VAFGFGGKLVRFGIHDSKSKITIDTFAVDSQIGDASVEFDKVLAQGDLTAICENKIAKAATGGEGRLDSYRDIDIGEPKKQARRVSWIR